MERLKYLSTSTVETLRENVGQNAERYRGGQFNDLMSEGEWSIELDLEVDLTPLTALDPSGTPKAEIENSMLVWASLHEVTPSLAYEEGVWVRLTHVECLDFARRRWLLNSPDDEKLVKAVHLHMFADTLNRRRDDNALSRLWWNAYIANMVMPQDMRTALGVMLKRADIRSNIIERSLTGSRIPVTAGIIRIANSESWITGSEAHFRRFMKTLNLIGGGVLFEAMTVSEIDRFMTDCAARAQTALLVQHG